EQPVGVVAVSALGLHATGRRVRVRQESAALELREVAAHRRRPDVEPTSLDEALRPHRLPRRDVLVDDATQDLLLPVAELRLRRDHVTAAGAAPAARQGPPAPLLASSASSES